MNRTGSRGLKDENKMWIYVYLPSMPEQQWWKTISFRGGGGGGGLAIYRGCEVAESPCEAQIIVIPLPVFCCRQEALS